MRYCHVRPPPGLVGLGATRAEVLIRDSLTPPQVDAVCEVLAGEWLSLYDGVTVTDPTLLEVDHLVGLEEAWLSGAWQWDAARRNAYANANDLTDPRTLRAVTATSNESKGDSDPSVWLPLDKGFTCIYLGDWVAVKARWRLSVDQTEVDTIRNTLTQWCSDHLVSSWPETEPFELAVSMTNAVPHIQPIVETGSCDPAYPTVCIPPRPPDLNCGDITQRKFAVLPPDPHNFDGVGCES